MRSIGVRQRGCLSVIAACLGERPERAWLAELQAHDAALSLTFVDDRVALIRRARSLQPRVVLLPLRDAYGMSSVPLIARLRENVPSARVVVLLAPGTPRGGLAETIRVGGEIAILARQADLRSVLYRTNQAEGLSTRELEATRSLLGGLQPTELREVLVFCVMNAHRRLTVGEVAMRRGLSPRAFARQAEAAQWPSPSELIGWGGLLRASLMEWSESSRLPELARASGFASTRTLQRIAERLLQKPIACSSDLAPLLVSSRLIRRVQRLERATAH
jgi:AraC-like DNA-binding protein